MVGVRVDLSYLQHTNYHLKTTTLDKDFYDNKQY